MLQHVVKQKENSHSACNIVVHLGLHKRKLPLHLSYSVKYLYISLAAVLGVVRLLTLPISFQAIQRQDIKPNAEEGSKAARQAGNHTQCLVPPVGCAWHPLSSTRMSYGLHRRWTRHSTKKLFDGERCIQKRNCFPERFFKAIRL